MKLIEKIVSRATENTLLQIETISQLSSVLGISLGVIAVILESKGNEKIMVVNIYIIDVGIPYSCFIFTSCVQQGYLFNVTRFYRFRDI